MPGASSTGSPSGGEPGSPLRRSTGTCVNHWRRCTWQPSSASSSTAPTPTSSPSSWSAAIGYTTLGGAGSYVLLVDEAGEQPKLLLQRVDEPKSAKNRMHVDIETPTVDEEVARLEALGARRVEADAIEEHGNRWVVMADPEGNEFCVCNAGAGWQDRPPATGRRSRDLRRLCRGSLFPDRQTR